LFVDSTMTIDQSHFQAQIRHAYCYSCLPRLDNDNTAIF
jgi:hypothetical protein